MVNWIVLNRTDFTFYCVKENFIFTLNGIIWNRTDLTFYCVKEKIILILNGIFDI